MRNILCSIFFILCFVGYSYSQQKRLVLADNGVFTLSLGTVVNTSTYYIHSVYKKEGGEMTPPIIGGVVFSGTIGVGLYIISFDTKPKKIIKSKHPRWL